MLQSLQTLKVLDQQSTEKAIKAPIEYLHKTAKFTSEVAPRLFSKDEQDRLNSQDYFFSYHDKPRVNKLTTKDLEVKKFSQQLIQELEKILLAKEYTSADLANVIYNYAKADIEFAELCNFFNGLDISNMEEAYEALKCTLKSLYYLPAEFGSFFDLAEAKKLEFPHYRSEDLSSLNSSGEWGDSDLFDLPTPVSNSENQVHSPAFIERQKDLDENIQRALELFRDCWQNPKLNGESLKDLFEKHLADKSKSTDNSFCGKILSSFAKLLQEKLSSKANILINGAELSPQEKKEAEYLKTIVYPLLKEILKKSQAFRENQKAKISLELKVFEEPCKPLLAFLQKDNIILNVKDWLEEQRQHSIARFRNLTTYYTAFVNSTLNLETKTEELFKKLEIPNKKNVITNIISQIFEHSHIKIDKQKASEEQLQKITVRPQGHRDARIMGQASVKLSKAEKCKLSEMFNFYFGNFKADLSDCTQQLDRAHTLPFPVNFAWKWPRVEEFLTSELGGVLEPLAESAAPALENEDTEEVLEPSAKVNLSKEIFEKIVSEGIEHQALEEMFAETFEFYKQKVNSKDELKEFILNSLKILASFYLRLFSETELQFEFINKEIDALSEWKISENDHYKISLAKALQELIATALTRENISINKQDTVQALKTYFSFTKTCIDKAWQANQIRPTHFDKKQPPSLLFRNICILHLQEGLEDIFNV